jgi:hypothetical protein
MPLTAVVRKVSAPSVTMTQAGGPQELLARDDAENEQRLTEGVELAQLARPRLDGPEPQTIGDRAAHDDEIARHRRRHEPQRHEMHDGEHHERGGEEQLVRGRIEHAAESALPTEALGDEPVEQVRCGPQEEQAERDDAAHGASSAIAIGAISRILSAVMRFGI